MENQTDEKLLTGSQSQEFLPKAENIPNLSAKEFLKITPPRELKNVFGNSPSVQTFKPTLTPPPTIPPVKSFTTASSFSTPKKKPLHLKTFFLAVVIFCIVAVVGLYIWGALLAH
ncbi:MAG: hypothetical protein V4467_04865 [Patescibacteria group bacterium]